MKKLLFITPIFPSSKEDDTVVPFIYQFTLEFAKKYPEIEIHVLAINYPFDKKTFKIDEISIFCARGNFNKGVFSVIRFIKTLKLAIILYRKNRYVSVLSFWYGSSAMIGKLLKLFFKCKHKIWMQGQDVKSNNLYLKLLPSKGDDIIVMGKQHQNMLTKNHHINTKNIANVAIHKDTFPKLKTNQRTIDIMGVGNLGPIKNYTQFIDVIFEIKKNNINLNVVICGDGEEKKQLEEKVIALKLTENVTFLGYVTNQKVKELLNDSKIFLHTSLFEGNPMVIQEALFSGCKVVSSINIKDNNEPVENFYFTKDINIITLKINQLLNSNSLTHSRVHHFKIENTLETVYNLLLDNFSKTV